MVLDYPDTEKTGLDISKVKEQMFMVVNENKDKIMTEIPERIFRKYSNDPH